MVNVIYQKNITPDSSWKEILQTELLNNNINSDYNKILETVPLSNYTMVDNISIKTDHIFYVTEEHDSNNVEIHLILEYNDMTEELIKVELSILENS
tara:strand:- start:1910 stop:2200 length:291 start_codon:yes stop_codon:yes gene_type:complete